MKEITVRIRNNYGTTVYYPVCINAAHFAQIAGTKTLGIQTIAHIKAMGYTVKVQQTEPQEL
ncbi:hypothetical protein [Rhodoferax mekongensis]|uniref:Uncharacterized protein n=1 Tax=Rhodoferax mekongensis TaxID=3068341 RepID=A0ABZ0B4L5_9BURK|nr:hypothetical protein [Rhodoferax sp. TBRC 17307]WNO06019.1 hypothetical protein RAN89_06205 [Rhodoferax sp. TBRC 17307]